MTIDNISVKNTILIAIANAAADVLNGSLIGKIDLEPLRVAIEDWDAFEIEGTVPSQQGIDVTEHFSGPKRCVADEPHKTNCNEGKGCWCDQAAMGIAPAPRQTKPRRKR